jgi:uncharacterized glyoxalase superfamily protein PhnB
MHLNASVGLRFNGDCETAFGGCGRSRVPLAHTFWATLYGLVRDRFGIP